MPRVMWKGTAIRIADALACAVFAGMCGLLAARVAAAVGAPSDAAPVLLAALCGWAAADLVSGIVHWFCDTFFDGDTPVIGPALIGPFREHHRDPRAMTRRGFLEVNRSNYLVMMPVVAVALWRDGPAPAGPVLFGQAVLLFFAVAVALTNQFHKWAHEPRPPRLARWLQRARLAVDPAHHARHHASGGARAFCVTTGWWDPPLDGLGVFERLEPRRGRP